MVEAYVKISRTGLLCLALVGTFSLPGAQAREDGASADQQPAAQEPAPQQPAPEPKPPAGTPAPAEAPRLKLPPPPPKVVDVRMPGEAGYFVGISGWLPSGQIWSDKGHAAAFLDPSKLELPGKAKPALGAEVGIAVGLHNSIRVSYFNFRRSGTTTAPHELVIFDQTYSSGNELATTAKVSNYKISYEYLTWPYPVEARHFRLKTL